FLLLGSSADVPEKTVVAKYPWSGVYTTRTTKTVADHFRTEWRTVTSVGAMSSMASRSRSDLQICFLFGGVHLPPGEQPATDALGEADSRIRATQELSRLAAETVTPKGTVIIDGWAPGDLLA